MEDIIQKAWQCVSILRASKFKLDGWPLECTYAWYVSFARHVLEYEGPIRDNCTQEDKAIIESIANCNRYE